MNTATISSSVTTPLALAALVLLLGAGLARAILRNARPVLARQVVKYGFTLSIVLGALANINYLIMEHAKTEALITGTVHNQAGRGGRRKT